MSNESENKPARRVDDKRAEVPLNWSEGTQAWSEGTQATAPSPATPIPVDVMIDIETLGTAPGSAILSIGAVVFGPEGLGDTFYAPILLQSCVAVGLTIDPNTIAWWMQQSDEARAAAFKSDADALSDVLEQFTCWFGLVGAERPWCHGATFDVPLLEVAYKACGLQAPWRFYNVRDTRTLYDLSGVKVDRAQGTQHNALDDAIAQAEAAAKAMRILDVHKTIASTAVEQAEPAQAEETVRFCPHCASIGDIDDKYRDCCPDGSVARRIPRKLAEVCRDTFKLAISAASQAAPASPEQVQALTDERIAELNREAQDQGISGIPPSIHLARAIERELRGAAPSAAAPAAPAARPELPAILFDGKAVLDEVRAHSLNPPRTSADNVSEVLDAVVRLMRKEGASPAAPSQIVAPWLDFNNQPIHHGARLVHPDGNTFVAVRLAGHKDESDAWRGVYDYDPAHVSRLCLQVGDKGRAVLVEASPAAEQVAIPEGWISVEDRLPEGTCLASYQPHHRGHKPRIIRAVYFKQYQIQASGDDGESIEYNEADDTDYIKAGWYERIDNWGDFASVAVCEGIVTHWMPLPAAPGAAAPAAPIAAAQVQEEVRDQALQFADHIINGMFEGGDWDGASVQELAIKYGLLKQETMSEPCGDDGACQCAKNVPFFPAICYRKTYSATIRVTKAEANDKLPENRHSPFPWNRQAKTGANRWRIVDANGRQVADVNHYCERAEENMAVILAATSMKTAASTEQKGDAA